jgi:molybdate/tungstate transport system substrate-binding protein
LVVFCAGSLIIPFAQLEEAFERYRPDVDLRNECHGSIQVIRHVTELHELIDVVATADYALIPMLMYESSDPESGKPYASWYIRFATNQLSLAYSTTSRYAQEINAQNWPSILARPDIKFGLADPRFDAAGYRALMVLRLAEDYYGDPAIFENLIQGRFVIPITIFEWDDYTEITVPEILEPVPDSGIVVRGASVHLIALLESGDLDYAFEYQSVIRQHGLSWVDLPPEINLGDAEYQDRYGKVQVKLDFQRFASVKPVFWGEQIGYGITIPGNAPHPELAEAFISFLLGPQGEQIMDANSHPLSQPPVCDQPENVPPSLRVFCESSP